MAKQISQTTWIIIAIVAIAVFYYGGTQGFFSTVNNYQTETNNALQNNNPSYTAGIHFSSNTICSGSQTTGTIDSNMPGATCNVYMDTGSGYNNIGSVILNSAGSFSQTQTGDVGNIKFKAICMLNNLYTTTNEATLVVNNCQQNQNPVCTETDGGVKEFLAGSVAYNGSQYNDECKTSNSVNEYYCDDLGLVQMGTLPCANGCEGGACNTEPIVCHDSDSDLPVNQYLMNRGTCHDSSQSVQDTCDGTMLKEYYCEPTFLGQPMCGYTSYNCDGMIPGSSCSAGKCVLNPN